MPGTTVFRDRPPRGRSFAIQASDVPALFGETTTALYFIHSSTWVQQHLRYHPLPLPLLLVQPRRPNLRIGKERVAAAADHCDVHVLVYSIPSGARASAREALLADRGSWRGEHTTRWLLMYDPETGRLASGPPDPSGWF